VTLRSLTFDLRPARALSLAAAFLELSKPRMVTLILVTTAAGFYMAAPGSPDYLLLGSTLVGTALVAAGALALNQLMEREPDLLMERTRRRPIPDGRLQPTEALLFGAATVGSGLLWLTLAVNPLAALVTAAIVVSYLFLYTPMKRRSALCTVVGAFPGALPPVAGWAAASGELGTGAAVLFGIMFFWQIPHSLAIAWLYREDYRRAGFRLLPTVEPDGRSTGRHIIVNALALLGVGLLPTLIGLAGWVYFVVALAMGAWMLADGVRAARGLSATASARRLMYTSFVYVPVVLAAMSLDRISGV
jgi:protoheme IX farnesyltransferase